MRRRPRLYFSFRSPYSWMTIHRLRRSAPETLTELDWYPYWDPDESTAAGLAERGAEFHYVPMSRAKHRYVLMDTKRLAAGMDLPMAWPIDVDPWWELPHLAWLMARRTGRQMALYDALTVARWHRGEDICTPGVLRAAAVTAGLDPDRLLSATEDPSIRVEGVDCLAAAYEDDVFGIPYLKLGRDRFWGLDRVEAFLAAWRKVAAADAVTVPPVLLDRVGAYDADTAGGCG